MQQVPDGWGPDFDQPGRAARVSAGPRIGDGGSADPASQLTPVDGLLFRERREAGGPRPALSRRLAGSDHDMLDGDPEFAPETSGGELLSLWVRGVTVRRRVVGDRTEACRDTVAGAYELDKSTRHLRTEVPAPALPCDRSSSTRAASP